MIELVHGDLLKCKAEALVNPVNCVGVMGKGLALQFRFTFPANYRAYHDACQHKQVILGHMFVFKTQYVINPKFIINFPTKDHWIHESRIEYIHTGLIDLCKIITQFNIQSIAVPRLGCGLGGLQWSAVKPLILDILGNLSKVTIYLFEPTTKHSHSGKQSNN